MRTPRLFLNQLVALKPVKKQLACIGLVWALSLSTWGQFGANANAETEKPAVSENPMPTLTEVEHLEAEVAQQLHEARSQFSVYHQQEGNPLADFYSRSASALESQQRSYRRYKQALQNLASLDAERREWRSRVDEISIKGSKLEPPFTLNSLDDLLDKQAVLELEAENVEKSIDLAESSLSRAKQVTEKIAASVRTLQQQLEEDSTAIEVRRSLDLARIRLRKAEVDEMVQRQGVAAARLQREILPLRQQMLEPDIAVVQAGLVLTSDEMQQALEKLEQRKKELEAELRELQLNEQQVARELDRVVATNPSDEAIAGARARHRLAEARANFASQEIHLLTQAELIAQRRYEIYARRFNQAELETWETEVRELLLDLEVGGEVLENEVAQVRADLDALDSRLAGASELSPAVRSSLETQQQSFREIIELVNELAGSRKAFMAQADRLLDSIHEHVYTFHVSDVTSLIQKWGTHALDFEVFALEDKTVRVREILAMLGLIIVGFSLSYVLTHVVLRWSFSKVRLNPGVSSSVETLTYYALLVGIGLYTLSALNIPLTSFSVVSGALAVGIGFGSQTLLKNFISGIILLLERPVSRGDIIRVGEANMEVEKVGIRSTRVRGFDHSHTLVPNGMLLEEMVTNWTLSGKEVRGEIEVGVSYDADPERVKQLLEQLMEDEVRIHSEPAPFVRFINFGASSLDFKIFYWVRIDQRFVVESDMRFSILKLLRAEGIEIPYPQRDVHMLSKQPLEVKLAQNTSDDH